MDKNTLIAELAQYLSWPVVVAFSVFYLRDKVGGLGELFKSLKVKVGDAEIGFQGQDSAELAALPVELAASNEAEVMHEKRFMPKPDSTGVRAVLENTINNQLSKVDSPSSREKILVSNLAKAQMDSFYKDIYQVIWGSQISLLDDLNLVRTFSLSKAEDYFLKAKEKYPDYYSTYGFEQYISYLVESKLVSKIGVDIHIEDLGIAFLVWLVEVGYTKDKPA